MGKRGGTRLSDTEALARKGINRPGARVAPFGGNVASERGADDATQGPRSQFQRTSGSGDEGLGCAVQALQKGK